MAKVRGYQERPNGLMAYIKVGKQQRTKLFPFGTDPDEIAAWRSQMKLELKNAQPVRGTLAHDIARFLARQPAGRSRDDLAVLLNRWAETPLGAKPRLTITKQEVGAQLERWKKGMPEKPKGFSGSTLNHLKQSLLTLWRELDKYIEDEKKPVCPALGIAKFEESQPRKGFFEQHELDAVLKELGPDHVDVVTFAAFSGWRRSEFLNLRWEEVDIIGAVIKLSPERSKNEEGRTLPIIGPLVDVMKRRMEEREKHGLPWVFTYAYGGKRTPVVYRQMGDFRKVWKSALKRAGCAGKTLHDFRRTVVRNLTRAGNPEKISMAWTGHKTDAVFRRYNIVNEADLRNAGAKLARFMGHEVSGKELTEN